MPSRVLQVVEAAVHGERGRGEHGRAHAVEEQLAQHAPRRRWASPAGRRRGRASRRSRRARRPRPRSTKRELARAAPARGRRAPVERLRPLGHGQDRGAQALEPRAAGALASSAMRGASSSRGRSRRPLPCASSVKKPLGAVAQRLHLGAAPRARRARAAFSSRSTSRHRSSTRCDETCTPKYWVATSSSRCASSRITRVVRRGSPRRSSPSFTARSAQSRWWFTTTMSASSARWRMRVTQQGSKSGQDWPMQFSLAGGDLAPEVDAVGQVLDLARGRRCRCAAPSPRRRGRAGSRRGGGSCPPGRTSGSAAGRGSSPRPFITRDVEVAAERPGQERDVLVDELLLQVLGAGGDHHAPAQLDRGQQVGEGLAGAGARLGQQHAAVRQDVAHGLRQLLLGRTLLVSREGAGECSTRPEERDRAGRHTLAQSEPS